MGPIIVEVVGNANSAREQLSVGPLLAVSFREVRQKTLPIPRGTGETRYRGAATMSPRANALVDLLHHELARIGRPGVAVTLGPNERTVTLEDPDGRWQGPVPIAYGALIVCEEELARDAPLWKRIALPSA
jgi:hypothetical protein